MDFTKYEPTLSFPTEAKKPSLSADSTALEAKAFASALRDYEEAQPAHLLAIGRYYAEQAKLMQMFTVDAIAHVGLTDNPKADKAFGLAWQRGHSSGYSEVLNELYDLADLLLKD